LTFKSLKNRFHKHQVSFLVVKMVMCTRGITITLKVGGALMN